MTTSTDTPIPPTAVRNGSARGPLAWMAKNTVAANLLMLFMLVGGVLMIGQIKQEVFPEFDLDMVLINVPYPGASPAEVEQGIILAVEEAVRGLEGVKEVRSTANESVGVVAVDLLVGTDPQRALSDIKAAVDRVTSFPEDSERPVIALATNRQQVINLVLYGDKSERELRRLVERTRDELLADPGITYVELAAVRPYEISIEVPEEQLRRYGLTLPEIASRIRAASVEVPGGEVKTSAGQVLLRTSERRLAGSEFEEIAILSRPDGSEVKLREIATVRDGFEDTDQEAVFNGKPAAMVRVYRIGDQTPIQVVEAVNKYIEENKHRFPQGVELATWNDRSEIYRDRVDLLRRNAMLGLVLVLIILGLFLELRLAFWVTLGIPISFIGTFLFMPAMNVSINMISLFAFIVTLGMVVDDAIVVGEAIYRLREQGRPWLQAAIEGVREMAQPVIFSILTTCMAFAPLLFVPGVSGKFFRVIPAVVIAVLLLSLVESLLILPAHLSHRTPLLLRLALAPLEWCLKITRLDRVAHGLEHFVERYYRPVIDFTSRRRYLTAAACIATLIGSIGLVVGGRVGTSFFPKIEGDSVSATIEMPFGTPVKQTREAQQSALKALREELEARGGEDRYSRGIFAEIGSTGSTRTSARGGSGAAGGSNLAEVSMRLVPSAKREFTAQEFTNAWRDRIGELKGVENLSFRFAMGPGAAKDINLELSHPDIETLESAAARLAQALSEYSGVTDVDDGFQEGKEQLDFRIKSGARRRNLTELDLARQVRAAFFGSEALRQQRGRDEIRVYVRRPKRERESLHFVEQLIVRPPGGGELPVAQAAEVTRGRSYTKITRVDGRRVVNVTADVATGTNANAVVADLTKRGGTIDQLRADVESLRYAPAGNQREQAETLGSLKQNFIIALIAMYILIAIAFGSYLQPIVVLSAIPFGMVGAIAGHLLMGFSLSIVSFMGIVALSGVVVNDSLILVVAVNEYRAQGMSLMDAVRQGGLRRFRPILLTSLTTFFGLMPMILETSTQARFLIPMAVSLGFGVLAATVVILILVPSLYLILEDAIAFTKAHTPQETTPGSRTPSPTP